MMNSNLDCDGASQATSPISANSAPTATLPNRSSHLAEHYLSRLAPSPAGWLASTDVPTYAARQATSCIYLEEKFPAILVAIQRDDLRAPVSALFDYLTELHKRQFRDLSAVTAVSPSPNRQSYYFDSMYQTLGIAVPIAKLESADLCNLLAAHAISYPRGHERYALLGNYDDPSNVPFKPVWNAFFQDAIGNAKLTIAAMESAFPPDQVEAGLDRALLAEEAMMKQIWKRNGVN